MSPAYMPRQGILSNAARVLNVCCRFSPGAPLNMTDRNGLEARLSALIRGGKLLRLLQSGSFAPYRLPGPLHVPFFRHGLGHAQAQHQLAVQFGMRKIQLTALI